MSIRITKNNIGDFKTVDFWGIDLVVPQPITHIVADKDGVVKYMRCKNGDVPYLHPETARWGITIDKGSYVLMIGHIEFEGDWRESLVEVPCNT